MLTNVLVQYKSTSVTELRLCSEEGVELGADAERLVSVQPDSGQQWELPDLSVPAGEGAVHRERSPPDGVHHALYRHEPHVVRVRDAERAPRRTRLGGHRCVPARHLVRLQSVEHWQAASHGRAVRAACQLHQREGSRLVLSRVPPTSNKLTLSQSFWNLNAG